MSKGQGSPVRAVVQPRICLMFYASVPLAILNIFQTCKDANIFSRNAATPFKRANRLFRACANMMCMFFRL